MKKRIILLFIVILILAYTFFKTSQETWGLNKTVGWAWELSNINWWIGIVLAIAVFVLAIILSYRFTLFLFKQLQEKKN